MCCRAYAAGRTVIKREEFMGKLENVFSWSFSAAHDFEECRRKRYWSKYGSWGGWDKQAPPEQRKAYQLNKMDNIYSLQGTAAESAVMWVLREHQRGVSVTVEQAYEAIAKPMLNRCWMESKKGDWQANPKQFCCLREHYYKVWDAQREKERTEAVVKHTKMCIANFIERVLPRLASIRREDEIEVTHSDRGDPESFVFNGVKIYAIPDFVYRAGDMVNIHDWKAGKVKESHQWQLALYGLWAHVKHGVAPEKVCCYVEYLATGQVAPFAFNAQKMDEVITQIGESVADMSGYLEDEDRARNEALPKEDWELCGDESVCRNCNFYELCAPELNAG